MSYHYLQTLVEPWWEKQPSETWKAFNRFTIYRDMTRRERSFGEVARRCGAQPRAVEQQGKAGRWAERAGANDQQWDAEQSRELARRVQDQAEKLSEAHINAATELLYAVRRAARHIIDNGMILEPGDAARWADVSIKLSKAAKETPDQIIRVTGHDDGPLQVEIPELDGLTPNEQKERVSQMLSGVARLDDYRERGETA